MTPLLRANRYCGYINLNTIVNEQGIWPLEFTCRFGYPGFAVLGPLQQTPWGDLFRAMATKTGSAQMLPGFCVAIVITTPPFPYDRKAISESVGLPVLFDCELTQKEYDQLYYGEVGLVNGQLVTTGQFGWTMVATAAAKTIAEARLDVYRLADKILVPNVRYRRDIGAGLIAGDFTRLEKLRLLENECFRGSDRFTASIGGRNEETKYMFPGEGPHCRPLAAIHVRSSRKPAKDG
jgi:phosphoribosylamine--glycine ligase